MSKKIVIVSNSTWNIYNFRLNVLKKLTEANWEVTVVAPIDDYIVYLEQFPKVTHLPLRNMSRKGKNPLNDFRLMLELRRIYQRIKPDVILHYTIKPNIYGSFAARFSSAKIISVITGLGYAFIHNGLLSNIVQGLYALAFRNNFKVLFENQDDRILFENKGIITPKQGFSMKGCGVDISHFQPISGLANNGKLIFSFIGRLLYDKGIQEYVDAAKMVKNELPNAEFWVVGDLDEGNPASVRKNELVEWIEEGIIKYKGFKSDVRPIIDQSHCVILPSYREAIPRSLTEAMAMARPIITTQTAGCWEAIDEGKNGYLVPLKSAKGLAKAMQKFSKLNHAEKQRMGQFGYQKAQQEFDDRLIAQHFLDVIEAANKK